MNKQNYNDDLDGIIRTRYKGEKVRRFGFVWYILPNNNWLRLDKDNDDPWEKCVTIYGRKGSRWGAKMNFCDFKHRITFGAVLDYLDKISK